MRSKYFDTFLLAFLLLNCSLVRFSVGQTRILHYTETSGFDHLTRNASLAMFEQIGLQHGFSVDDDSTGTAFNSLNTLQQYSVIVFSNTTGDSILDSLQQQNFILYINGGGNFIGIHSASDTYRHSTANGSNTGAWDWYAELLGASVRQNPNHVNGTPVYRIDAITSHPLLTGLPNPWYKAEEYYYWEGGYFNPGNIVLQEVEQTIGPNGLVNSYDSARAVTWYRQLPGGARVFYTALGHAASNYTSDPDFYHLLENALLWAGNITSVNSPIANTYMYVYPNPCNEYIYLSDYSIRTKEITLTTLEGKIIGQWLTELENSEINLQNLAVGMYVLKIKSGDELLQFQILKIR